MDTVDYTAEIYGHTTSNIKPFLPPWLNDSGYFQLYGITDCLELPEFTRGEKILIDGRYITSNDREKKNDVCMINETIARLNDIRVGDVIDFKMADESYAAFSVIGIYKDQVSYSTSNITISYNLPENCVFVPLSAFEKAKATGCYNYQIKLNDDSLIGEVERLVNKYSMCEGYPAYFIRVSEISEAGNREMNSLQGALRIVQNVFVVIAAALMFIFVYSLIVSRKKDFGVLLALGISKKNIVTTLLAEFCISIFAGILISCIISFSIGTNVSMWIVHQLEKTASVECLGLQHLMR